MGVDSLQMVLFYMKDSSLKGFVFLLNMTQIPRKDYMDFHLP